MSLKVPATIHYSQPFLGLLGSLTVQAQMELTSSGLRPLLETPNISDTGSRNEVVLSGFTLWHYWKEKYSLTLRVLMLQQAVYNYDPKGMWGYEGLSEVCAPGWFVGISNTLQFILLLFSYQNLGDRTRFYDAFELWGRGLWRLSSHRYW